MPKAPASTPLDSRLQGELQAIYDVAAVGIVNVTALLLRELDEHAAEFSDLALFAEARRDAERALLVLEGTARRWGVDLPVKAAKPSPGLKAKEGEVRRWLRRID